MAGAEADYRRWNELAGELTLITYNYYSPADVPDDPRVRRSMCWSILGTYAQFVDAYNFCRHPDEELSFNTATRLLTGLRDSKDDRNMCQKIRRRLTTDDNSYGLPIADPRHALFDYVLTDCVQQTMQKMCRRKDVLEDQDIAKRIGNLKRAAEHLVVFGLYPLVYGWPSHMIQEGENRAMARSVELILDLSDDARHMGLKEKPLTNAMRAVILAPDN